ncbi:Uncharacterized conserved protein YecT, DUF1311 family [Thioclava dalianensis]|uniref:lysozyme inhibitor LprI family protein n=1 Tax=Thioclava dalianensis TaxID=1185766 RepID=UPI00057125F2|nr:lysozyme inhibitor LprI family protein [Thioclava dalianensis]SFN25837.1 Uncharacterized conserved protein YecT, DUF1311 family [Thioclava dalianensis]
MRWVVPLVLLLSATAARSEPVKVPYSPQVLDACLAANVGLARQACIGVGAQYCMAQSGFGSSNAGMGMCFGAERDDWDARLNAAYQAVLKTDGASDAEMKSLGSAAPPQVPALREMQRDWVAFRDAACTYEMTTWGGGSGAGPAGSECEMTLTARQALRLMARRDRLEARSQ